MNEYKIIFWISFIVIFLGHFLFLKVATTKLNFFYYITSVIGSFVVYSIIDYLAVSYGPEIAGTYASQSIIGMVSGWFISKNLKNVFRLTEYSFITAALLITSWYNYVF